MDNFNELEMEKIVRKITLELKAREITLLDKNNKEIKILDENINKPTITILDEHSRKTTIVESK